MEKVSWRKIIRYGNHIEIYEYEKEPDVLGRRRGISKTDSDNLDLGAGGTDTLSEGELGKRQDNARRASLAFRRLVLSNLSGTELPLLLTLTYSENITDLATGYSDYRTFIQALRNKYGKAFKYICVPEFQRRGAVHFHALFWGLPSEVFSQERQTRTIAVMWGNGFVYMKQTDGNDRLSSYLVKYMAKAFTDPKLRNKRAYTSSKNLNRPETINGEFSFWPIVEECERDGELIKESRYWTKYLGDCRHRHFKLTS